MSPEYELLDLLYEGVPDILADENGDLDTNPKKLEKIVQLQFTGLLDKNGKSIFEGDILKGVIDEGYRLRIVYKEHEYLIGEIKWDYSGFMWELHENDKRYIQELVHVGNKEVIGNIYENETLLKN